MNAMVSASIWNSSPTAHGPPGTQVHQYHLCCHPRPPLQLQPDVELSASQENSSGQRVGMGFATPLVNDVTHGLVVTVVEDRLASIYGGVESIQYQQSLKVELPFSSSSKKSS